MTKSLTQYSKASGCGCKIAPAVLQEILQGLTLDVGDFPKLVQGNHGSDDCSVYDLGDGQYLLQTLDFFTPLVDDAFVYGQAAAANALSDIWAMAGRPVMANAIMGWPIDTLPVSIAREVMKGALSICKEAGVALAGGHTIDSTEPFFGLSVTGLIHAAQLKTNAGAKIGDTLLLTKPLGIGMLSAAHKRGICSVEQNEALTMWLIKTNHIGQKLAPMVGVHALTDITGFGLAGHLLEMCNASGVAANIHMAMIPKLAEAESLAANFVLPDNAMRNWNAYSSNIILSDSKAFPWLVDPQSSGGLLIAADPKTALEILTLCKDSENFCSIIGEITPGNSRILCD
ncbi:MAG: selenide, water dikinase SelD [Flavobacteriaceae bacterium]|nr:selenide, water dikinase SelD [Flavobacteriaceae bacterium]